MLPAQVVPESIRTSVYAFDKCIVGAIGALTTPLAGLLAEKAFGFTHLSKPHHATPGQALSPAGAAHLAREYASNVASARALENGLLYVMLAPMVRTRARFSSPCPACLENLPIPLLVCSRRVVW